MVEKELVREGLTEDVVVVEASSKRAAPNFALLASGVALCKLGGRTREAVRRLRLTPDIVCPLHFTPSASDWIWRNWESKLKQIISRGRRVQR